MSETKRTLDEILKEIEDLAFNGEGPAKLRALAMLRDDRGGSAITLPEPMADGEIVRRLAIVMKASGPDLCHAAYAQAFPNAKSHVDDVPALKMDNMSPEDMEDIHRIRTLKALYRRFPEVKRPGFPTGYPAGRGAVAQQEWCRRMAAKCLLDERQRAAEGKAKEADWLERLKDPNVPPDVHGTADPA